MEIFEKVKTMAGMELSFGNVKLSVLKIILISMIVGMIILSFGVVGISYLLYFVRQTFFS